MVAITLGLLAAFAAIVAAPWLCALLIRSLAHHWRSTTASGSAYNPLLELVQPQARHVIEVHEHSVKRDDSGTPPDDAPHQGNVVASPRT